MLDVNELFALPLDTSLEALVAIMDEAEARMAAADEGNEVMSVVRDTTRVAAAMAVSGESDEARQLKLVDGVLESLASSVWVSDSGMFKALARVRIYGAMSPTTPPITGAKPELLVTRAMIEALGLAEVATAIYAFIYLNTGAERVGTFKWRQAQPAA